MDILIKVIICLIIISTLILIFFLFKKKKNKPENVETYKFMGPALNNHLMYKERERKALNEVLTTFPKFTKETLYSNIYELTRRIINGQNNGYISQNAFQKSATDKVLIEIRNMKLVDARIINYENNYMSVAIIFENIDQKLYQLLMKINVQNGLLYLDSYNANLWFENK